jgi:hypothetical protein
MFVINGGSDIGFSRGVHEMLLLNFLKSNKTSSRIVSIPHELNYGDYYTAVISSKFLLCSGDLIPLNPCFVHALFFGTIPVYVSDGKLLNTL